MSRSRYFGKLSFLEVNFARELPTVKTARKWGRELPTGGAYAVVFNFDVDLELAQQITVAMGAEVVVFRSVPEFSPTASNRDRVLARFQTEATAERFGGAVRVWEAQGLWDPRVAARLAELGDALLALDPLAVDPLGENATLVEGQLARGVGYLRPAGIGGARRRFTEFDMDILAGIAQGLDRVWIAFGNVDAMRDAVALTRALASED